MLCDDLEDWDGEWMGGRFKKEEYIYIYILMVDSHCCMAETNTTL